MFFNWYNTHYIFKASLIKSCKLLYLKSKWNCIVACHINTALSFTDIKIFIYYILKYIIICQFSRESNCLPVKNRKKIIKKTLINIYHILNKNLFCIIKNYKNYLK